MLDRFFFQDRYTSTTTLVSSNTKFSSNTGGLGAIAGFAGFGVPSMTEPKILEAIKTIESYKFFKEISKNEDFLVNIAAAKGWDPQTKKIIFDKSSFVTDEGNEILIMHPQAIHQKFLNDLELNFDSDGGFLELSFEHYSPYFTKEVLDEITFSLNSFFRYEDILKAEKSIDYLYSQLAQTNLSEVRESLANIVESQLESLMLAEASEDDYLFKIIDPPQVPIGKSSFSKFVIAFIGLFSGLILSIFLFITLFYYKYSFGKKLK